MLHKKKDPTKEEKNTFIIVFIILIALIFALLLALIIITNKRNSDQEAEEYAAIKEGDYDEGYNVRINLSNIYEKGEKERAQQLYSIARKQSLAEKDYELYIFLVGDELSLMNNDERCETGLKLYEGTNVEQWPTADRYTFYAEARNANEECGNDGKAKEYDSKIDKMIEKGELDEESISEG